MYKRVLIKLSGEDLERTKGEHFNEETIARIVKEVNKVMELGIQVSLVVGGGNFWRGKEAPAGMDKVKADQIGMLGTVMNAMYVAEAFRYHAGTARYAGTPSQPCLSKKCAVMTPFEIGNITERYTKEAAVNYMNGGVVPMFAGGTGHPFFSTDSIAAIRACELEVDLLLFAKRVNSVLNGDPEKVKALKSYKSVSYQTIIEKEYKVADLEAVMLLKNHNINSAVFGLSIENGIVSACQGEENLVVIGGTKIGKAVVDEFY